MPNGRRTNCVFAVWRYIVPRGSFGVPHVVCYSRPPCLHAAIQPILCTDVCRWRLSDVAAQPTPIFSGRNYYCPRAIKWRRYSRHFLSFYCQKPSRSWISRASLATIILFTPWSSCYLYKIHPYAVQVIGKLYEIEIGLYFVYQFNSLMRFRINFSSLQFFFF